MSCCFIEKHAEKHVRCEEYAYSLILSIHFELSSLNMWPSVVLESYRPVNFWRPHWPLMTRLSAAFVTSSSRNFSTRVSSPQLADPLMRCVWVTGRRASRRPWGVVPHPLWQLSATTCGKIVAWRFSVCPQKYATSWNNCAADTSCCCWPTGKLRLRDGKWRQSDVRSSSMPSWSGGNMQSRNHSSRSSHCVSTCWRWRPRTVLWWETLWTQIFRGALMLEYGLQCGSAVQETLRRMVQWNRTTRSRLCWTCQIFWHDWNEPVTETMCETSHFKWVDF